MLLHSNKKKRENRFTLEAGISRTKRSKGGNKWRILIAHALITAYLLQTAYLHIACLTPAFNAFAQSWETSKSGVSAL